MKRDPVLLRPIPDDDGIPPTGGLAMVALMGHDGCHETTPSDRVHSFDFKRDEETPLYSRANTASDDCSEP